MALSTLAYALLAILAREPLAGNELAQRLRGRFSFLWPADRKEIPPELANLEAAALVERVEGAEPGKPLYAISDAGLATLRAWVAAPSEVYVTRDEFILKAYALWLVAPGEGIAIFREHERRHGDRLALLENQLAWLEQAHGEQLRQPGSPLFATYIAVRHGIGVEREYTEWCGWVANQLERPDDASAEGDGSA